MFELTGSVMKFEQAVRLVPGLEFLGAEDLEEDELDDKPAVYLMVPSEGALRNIVTLWRGWQESGTVPERFSAWKTLLTQLRDIRPWGPQDRITPGDFDILTAEMASADTTVRVEVELVFRRDGQPTEQEARRAIAAVGGTTMSQSRIAGAGYHALLADIPIQAMRQALQRDPRGLSGLDAIFQIRPQSIFHLEPIEEVAGAPLGDVPAVAGEPIAAIFDAVPLAGHPRLAGALSVDDPFDLERLAVGPRKHGSAMASAVIHGDLNDSWTRPLERPVYFVNMLYATADIQEPERFPDKLPADLFEQALRRSRLELPSRPRRRSADLRRLGGF